MSSKGQATIQRATSLLDLGRPADALAELGPGDPGDAGDAGDAGASVHAHCLRARALLALGRPDEAEQAAGQAQAAAPDLEWGYRLASIAARAQGELRRSVQLATEAVRLDPEEWRTHQNAATAHQALGDRHAALTSSAQAVQLAPEEALAHYTYARMLVLSGRPEAAEEALRRCLTLAPQDADALALLAELVHKQGDKERAQSLRVAAVEAAPQSTRHQRALLTRGGAVGGVLAISKLSLLFKGLFVLRLGGSVAGGRDGDGHQTAVLLGTLLLGWTVTFGVSRLRRRRTRATMPASLWDGLAATRHNSDLAWIATLAGFVAFGGLGGFLARLGRDQVDLTSVLVPLVGALVLVLCWRSRRGAARDLTLVQTIKASGRAGRHRLRLRSQRRTWGRRA